MYIEAIIKSKALAVDLEAFNNEAPDPKWSSGSFEPVEGVKEVPLDPNCSDGRTVRISAALSPK